MAKQTPRTYLEEVERYGRLCTDPVDRLRHARLCARAAPGRRRRRAVVESLWLASRRAARSLSLGDRFVIWAYRFRRALPQLAGVSAVWLLAMPLDGSRRPPAPPESPPVWKPAPTLPQPEEARAWLVETTGATELYSNGLRIENRFLTHTGQRSYPVWRNGELEWGRNPAGIVYHTTESDILPLEPENSGGILEREQNLLEYIRKRQLYHYVIDRFGRVWRVVPDQEYANHAGRSLWAESGAVYLNLNHGFLGVALEARSDGGITAPQLAAARLLTQLLRHRWSIRAGNCVSHDLVSVNPGRMLIGYHTDWAGGFPYRDLNLSNLYERPPASIAEFGFAYDAAFVARLGGRLWPGLRLAEQHLEREAARQGLSIGRYRRQLQNQYRRLAAATPLA